MDQQLNYILGENDIAKSLQLSFVSPRNNGTIDSGQRGFIPSIDLSSENKNKPK
jgi:hypothetical protein